MTNVKIGFYDNAFAKLGVEEAGDGRLHIVKVITEFPDRPLQPHISAFLNKLVDVHFTAARRRPDEVRDQLVKIKARRIGEAAEQIGESAVQRFADALLDVDLERLDREGWVVCGARPAVLYRWLRLIYESNGRFVFDERAVLTLVTHVLRRRFRPSALQGISPGRLVPIAVRDAGDDIEVQPLFYFPDGCGVRLPTGDVAVARPQGWYTLPHDWLSDKAIRASLPAGLEQWFEGCADRVRGHLKRFRRRVPGKPYESLPLSASRILGVYGSDLLNLAIRAAVDAQRRGI